MTIRGVEGGGGGFYGLWVFRRVSKITLGNIVWLSFNNFYLAHYFYGEFWSIDKYTFTSC